MTQTTDTNMKRLMTTSSKTGSQAAQSGAETCGSSDMLEMLAVLQQFQSASHALVRVRPAANCIIERKSSKNSAR